MKRSSNKCSLHWRHFPVQNKIHNISGAPYILEGLECDSSPPSVKKTDNSWETVEYFQRRLQFPQYIALFNELQFYYNICMAVNQML